jgi:hypothetical protein
MAEVPGPSVAVAPMPVKPSSVSGFSLLAGIVEGVGRVFVKEKVLGKDGEGCVKGLDDWSLRRATRGLEKRENRP